ncbi:WhiB family transcriptional regulator [Actinomycetospora lemnae]|uniref:Transcriptional regulator WhiB n=1 Tax=Actinomycetospora lemnae TaxID=3019891 RepID=A0ABT5T000_9PSEU|nr:WhiB family transcriptional regulator [Actinomycetospora sp. DW7H6]MDD7968445.1 WhiB family transcriptional regulator [Actinomycetospora sp. DW7H6]
MTDTTWRQRAACRDADPELFFPSAEDGPIHDAQVATAKAVCSRCPVRRPCLTEALERMPYGVAGGVSEQERQQLRRSGVRDGRSTGPASGGAR